MSNYGCFSISENQNNIKGRNLIYATVEIQFKILNIYFRPCLENKSCTKQQVCVNYPYGNETI